MKEIRKKYLSIIGAISFSGVLLTTGTGMASIPGFDFGTTEKNAPCLRCHSSMAAVGKSSYIDPIKFSKTMHAKIGCVTCHDGIGTVHPDGNPSPIGTKCADCHQDIAQQYARSEHVKNTPCGGCHDPHTVLSLTDVSGADVKRQCSGCHKQNTMTASHARWLPQAELHLATIPCISCHVDSKELTVTLNIVKRRGGKISDGLQPISHAELKKVARGGNILSLIDTNGDNVVTLSELRGFNFNPLYSDYCLAGVMTPSQISHDFKVINNRWDCTYCHAKGPSSLQSSVLALPTEEGSYSRVPVEKGAVIEALNGVPDFYLMGASRSDILNKIGLAILGGGMVMPVGHGMLRFLTRKNRQGKGH